MVNRQPFVRLFEPGKSRWNDWTDGKIFIRVELSERGVLTFAGTVGGRTQPAYQMVRELDHATPASGWIIVELARLANEWRRWESQAQPGEDVLDWLLTLPN